MNLAAKLNRPSPIAHYYGIRRIAARLGLAVRTTCDLLDSGSFLAYKRYHEGKWVWYTNEALLTAWEIAKCRVEKQVDATRQAARLARRAGSGHGDALPTRPPSEAMRSQATSATESA